MKTIFMGTPDFATKTLKALYEKGHDIELVVTQPDKSVGRSGKLVPPPVKQEALALGLEVAQPEKASDPDFMQRIKDIAPDVIVVVAYGQILKKDFLDIPKYGCVNVHASLLPKYRGAAPIQWSVINGDDVSGVTTMLMDEGIDTGDILLAEEVRLDDKETGGSLFEKLSRVGAELLIKTLYGLEKGSIVPVHQDESKATHAAMLSKKMGVIDFDQSADVIERFIRGMNPWPGAYTFIDGKKLTIWDGDVDKTGEASEESGTIVSVSKDHLGIQCKDSVLKVKELQLEGKKRMSTGDFLNGKKIYPGEKLG